MDGQDVHFYRAALLGINPSAFSSIRCMDWLRFCDQIHREDAYRGEHEALRSMGQHAAALAGLREAFMARKRESDGGAGRRGEAAP